VEERDASAAEDILWFALFKEIVEDERRKRRRVGDADVDMDSSDDDDGSDGGDAEEESQTRGVRASSRRARAAARRQNQSANGDASDHEMEAADVGDDYDEPYISISGTARRYGRSAPTAQSESQQSWASSHRASSALQSQTDSGQASGSAAAAAAAASQVETISPARAETFQRTLGTLLNASIFQDDAAELDPLLAEINSRVGQDQRFSREEAEAALQKMNDRNQIMWVSPMFTVL
jgi:DNA replication licensing factor MCM3